MIGFITCLIKMDRELAFEFIDFLSKLKPKHDGRAMNNPVATSFILKSDILQDSLFDEISGDIGLLLESIHSSESKKIADEVRRIQGIFDEKTNYCFTGGPVDKNHQQ